MVLGVGSGVAVAVGAGTAVGDTDTVGLAVAVGVGEGSVSVVNVHAMDTAIANARHMHNPIRRNVRLRIKSARLDRGMRSPSSVTANLPKSIHRFGCATQI